MAGCIVCQHRIVPFGPCDGYTYFQCERCGTIQLWPMPDQAEVEQRYKQEFVAGKHTEADFRGPDWWRTASRTYIKAMIKALTDYGVKGVVVDYGAGWGHLVEGLIENGFEARGLELSDAEVAYAQGRNLPVEQKSLTDVQGMDGKVAAITMSAVFEHFVDHDAIVSTVHRLLADNGIFVTMHPTATFFRLLGNIVRFGDKRKNLPPLLATFIPPWHTALFSISGTEQLIARHGFQLLSVRPAPQGRLGGLLGLVQVSLELVNKVGWFFLKTRWPLLTTHIFVFRKISP